MRENRTEDLKPLPQIRPWRDSLTLPLFLPPDNLAGPRSRLFPDRRQRLQFAPLIFAFMRRRNNQVKHGGKLRTAGMTVYTMILDCFSFLRRTSAGQISYHHPSGEMSVNMTPISINCLSHLSVGMASISINMLFHIARMELKFFRDD